MGNREKEILRVLDRLYLATYVVLSGNDDTNSIEGFTETIAAISNNVYLGILSEKTIELIDCINSVNKSDKGIIRNLFEQWYKEVVADVVELTKESCIIDRCFHNIVKVCERCSGNSILEELLDRLDVVKQTDEGVYNHIIWFYQRYSHFWGKIDPKEGNYDHFSLCVLEVKEHIKDICWLYKRLADYRSKKVLYGILRFWILLDLNVLDEIKENNFDDYFDIDLLDGRISEEEVFVDCGLYTGDTIESYISNFTVYKKMFLYDMVPKNIEVARKKLSAYDNLVFRNVGVGNKEQTGSIVRVKNIESSAGAISEDGETITPGADESVEVVDISIVNLDDDIIEPVTFIKMDIEGAERDAIKGCKRHILEEKPKLAICTYHHYCDLWEIPRLISSYRDDYHFYMRYHGCDIMAMEFYLLAV